MIRLTTCSRCYRVSTRRAGFVSRVIWRLRSPSREPISLVHNALSRCIHPTFSYCSKHIQMWYRNTKTLWCDAFFSLIQTPVGVQRPTVATLSLHQDALHVPDSDVNVKAVICTSVITVRLNGILIKHAMQQGQLGTAQPDKRPAAVVKIHSIVSYTFPLQTRSNSHVSSHFICRWWHQTVSTMPSINSQNRWRLM